jgi:hypothetical protein
MLDGCEGRREGQVAQMVVSMIGRDGGGTRGAKDSKERPFPLSPSTKTSLSFLDILVGT